MQTETYEARLGRVMETFEAADREHEPRPRAETEVALLRGALRLAEQPAPACWTSEQTVKMRGVADFVRDHLGHAEQSRAQRFEHLRAVDKANGANPAYGYYANEVHDADLDAIYTLDELCERQEAEQEAREKELEANCDVHGMVRIDRRDGTWYLPSEYELEQMCSPHAEKEAFAVERAAILDAFKLTLTWGGVRDGGYTGRVLRDIRERLMSCLPDEDQKALTEVGRRVLWTNARGEPDALELARAA